MRTSDRQVTEPGSAAGHSAAVGWTLGTVGSPVADSDRDGEPDRDGESVADECGGATGSADGDGPAGDSGGAESAADGASED